MKTIPGMEHSPTLMHEAGTKERRFSTNRTMGHLLLIGLLWAVIYLPGLWRPPLLDDADSVHAEAGREMVVRGDWVTLHANGIRYLEKAPLMYWGIAACFSMFGVSEWQARLPLTLSVLALLYCLYLVGRRVYGPRGGLFAAVVMGTSFGPFIFTRFLIPDIIVGLWLAMASYFFLRILEDPSSSKWCSWGFAAAAALSVLTKGLIGVVFPVAIIVVYLVATRSVHLLQRMHPLSSFCVFLMIAAPWHILAGIRNPAQDHVRGFFWFYFVNEHFLRYLNKRIPHDYDTVPLLLFWGLIFVWLIPWSAFLPAALREIPIRAMAQPLQSIRSRANLLFAIWALVILLFFSFSTRQEYYLLPALPAIALLIGGWLDRESEVGNSAARRSGVRSSAALSAIGLAGATASVAILLAWGSSASGQDLASLVKQNPQEYTLSFGHIFDLTPAVLSQFRVPLLLTAFSLGLGSSSSWFFRRKGQPGKGNVVLAGMTVVILLSSWAAFTRFSPLLSSKELAEAINRVYHPGDVIVIRGEYEDGSSLNFYTQRQVHILHGHVGLWYGSLFPDAPKIWETDASLLSLWDGASTVFLWSDVREPAELRGKPVFRLAYSGGKYILTNRSVGP